MRGDPARAEQILLQAIDAADDIGAVWDAITARRFLAIDLIDMGRYADADAVLDRALKDSEQTGERWNRAEMQARRALAAVKRHDLEVAERFVRSGFEAILPGDNSGDSEAHYALGQLRAAQGRDAEAEDAFRHSLKTLHLMAYSTVSADFCIGIARFFAERGKRAEAKDLLDQAETFLAGAGYTLFRDEIGQVRRLLNA